MQPTVLSAGSLRLPGRGHLLQWILLCSESAVRWRKHLLRTRRNRLPERLDQRLLPKHRASLLREREDLRLLPHRQRLLSDWICYSLLSDWHDVLPARLGLHVLQNQSDLLRQPLLRQRDGSLQCRDLSTQMSFLPDARERCLRPVPDGGTVLRHRWHLQARGPVLGWRLLHQWHVWLPIGPDLPERHVHLDVYRPWWHLQGEHRLLLRPYLPIRHLLHPRPRDGL